MLEPLVPDSAPTFEFYQGDATAVLRALAAESVQCTVTSPPYYWQRDYAVEGQIGHEPTIEGYVFALVAVMREMRRVLRRDGTVFLNLGDTYYSGRGQPAGIGDPRQAKRRFSRETLRAVDGPGLGVPRKSLIGIPWRVALALQADGWVLRSDIVWRKARPQPEPTARDRPHTTVEHVFVLARGSRYYFDRSALAGAEDVWEFPPAGGAGGAAPLPRALAARCIACGSMPGNTVLDPFCGSGTVLHAAVSMGRSAVGIDLRPLPGGK